MKNNKDIKQIIKDGPTTPEEVRKYLKWQEEQEKESKSKKSKKKKKKPTYETYEYEVEISGSGGERKSCEISEKTYKFFANNNDLLVDHVYHDINDNIPEDVRIGPWYDAGSFFEAVSFSFDDSRLTLDRDNQEIKIPMSAKLLKEMGVKLIRGKKDFKDAVKKGEAKYFFLGESVDKGSSHSKLVIDHPFDPKKLKVETCNFNGWETLESITYDNQAIEHYMGDSTGKEIEFQVLKIKRDK